MDSPTPRKLTYDRSYVALVNLNYSSKGKPWGGSIGGLVGEPIKYAASLEFYGDGWKSDKDLSWGWMETMFAGHS